jgi:hypothetical protein
MFVVLILAASTLGTDPDRPSITLGPSPDLEAVQQATEGSDDPKTQGKKEEKPPVYPPLSALKKEKLKRLFTSFKNRNPTKRKGFEKDMIAIGRGAIPSLIKNGETKNKAQGECIFNCLTALMDERDLVTLKSCYQSKAERLRLLAVQEIAAIK